MAFKSGGYCRTPAEYVNFFSEPDDKWKVDCDEDQSGFFNPKCRPWYRAVLENPNETIMLDLYPDAGTKQLVTSICIDVNEAAGEFYATICLDISITQGFFD